jgi:hypothetical protein
MQLYYFRYVDGMPIIEPEPMHLSDDAEARSEAMGAAVDIWAQGQRLGEDRRHWRVDVLDEADSFFSRSHLRMPWTGAQIKYFPNGADTM